MASEVYYSSLQVTGPGDDTASRIGRLFDACGFGAIIDPGDICAIKLHFGERGNTTHLQPGHIRPVVDRVKRAGGIPFLTDTATLYGGARGNAVDHIGTAVQHGFDNAAVGAPVIIADGLRSTHEELVPISGRHFQTLHIAADLRAADALLVVSHFKGHGLSGFGGAIKNLAMGGATRAGKRDQHRAIHPRVDDGLCTACGRCADMCIHGAIEVDDVSTIDPDRCAGCGACIGACPEGAIDIDWEHDIPGFIERMCEYALGPVTGREEKTGYISVLADITPECDCLPWSDPVVAPDIGILASRDPVAIDRAALDLVDRCGGAFRAAHAAVDYDYQIRYAASIGLGSEEYVLHEV